MDSQEKENKDLGAFASVCEDYAQYGLTKREYISAIAMQGLLVNAGRNSLSFSKPKEIAKMSVSLADELLNTLKD